MEIYQPHKIVSAFVNEDGELEIVRQYPSNIVYTCNPPIQAPDKVVKEIYRCEHGKIVLSEKIEGKHTPRSVNEERIEF